MYDLISSHGAVEDVIFFATHMEGKESLTPPHTPSCLTSTSPSHTPLHNPSHTHTPSHTPLRTPSSHTLIHPLIHPSTHFVPILDYEKVITHCIQHSNFTEALAVLSVKAAEVLKLPEKEHRARFKPFADLFYKFSPALVKKCAPDTVEAWIKMGKHLEPHKLIPALIQCNQVADSAQVRGVSNLGKTKLMGVVSCRFQLP